jgi:rifampicin phosphotransferase
MNEPSQATWSPPGPGTWICERSHGGPGMTPLFCRIASEHTAPTYRKVMADYGGAVDTIDFQFVNGTFFRRLVPLVGADRDKGKLPPKAVLWLVSRLHPEFRRREKRARYVLANKTFLAPIEAWVGGERETWRRANLDLQVIDPAGLDDDQLARHLRRLDEQLVRGWCRHHELHGSDLGPIGDLLAHAESWGLDLTAVMGLLRGSSPATTDAARHGVAIAAELSGAGVDPAGVTSVDQIRAVPGAAHALDAYLEEFGWRLISDYDIDGLTLTEIPATICALVRREAGSTTGAAATEAGSGHEETESALRARAADPAAFDQLLASARQAYGVRDDNGPLTWEWPAGLTRRAYLEAGTRLAAQGRLHHASHAFELDIPELAMALTGENGSTADEVATRVAHRAWQASLSPPDVLGPPPVTPDLSALPPGIRRTMALIIFATTLLDPDPKQVTKLHGLGIGARPYQGLARLADDPNRALQEMQPGEILVAPWTAPSYNAVLAIAGGVVVQEGGLLCHAAVMARELGLPAVVGCRLAMTEITSGDLVEIDPVAGLVRIVERAAPVASIL